MTYTLEFKELASEDINDAYSWYARQRENLGEEFLEELVRTVEKIQEHPTSFPKSEFYHSVFMTRFPYEVIYRIRKQKIFILAVYHGKRDPSKKLRR